MIFTSESGEKFEVVTSNLALTGGYLIAPIKSQPKWTVELSEGRQEVNIYLNGLDPTKAQAQLIKEAVEALMQNITGHVETEDDMWLHAHISSARAAFQKEQT